MEAKENIDFSVPLVLNAFILGKYGMFPMEF